VLSPSWAELLDPPMTPNCRTWSQRAARPRPPRLPRSTPTRITPTPTAMRPMSCRSTPAKCRSSWTWVTWLPPFCAITRS